MALYRYKTMLLVIFVVAALLIASPALQRLIVYPKTDALTEFWLLGPDHDGTYPSNVTAGQSSRLYLDVSNHLGSFAYYEVEIKFSSQSQFGPDSFNHTSSNLESLGSITVFAADNSTVEVPLDVSFDYNVNPQSTAQLIMQSVTVNGNVLPINSTITWNNDKAGFFGNIFFELWKYNDTTGTFQYHERYLGLWLRMNT